MKIRDYEIENRHPLVCVPITESTAEMVVDSAKELADTEAAIVEWRLDLYNQINNVEAVVCTLGSIREAIGDKLLLVTVRSIAQGGEGSLSDEELTDLLSEVGKSQLCDLIDVEFFAVEYADILIKRLHDIGVKVITSHHDFDITPDNNVMEQLLDEMMIGNADIVKLAVMPHSVDDVLRLMSVTNAFAVKNPDTPIITMSMGKLGMISRVTGEFYGSAVTFAAGRAASAPGQLPIDIVENELKLLHGILTNE